jgi:hypothetical protein
MDLPEELLYLVIYNLPLNCISTISLVNKTFSNLIYRLDWDSYVKYNNTLINFTNIDINFMKEQGKYLINAKYKDLIDNWIFFYPYVKNILDIVNNRDNISGPYRAEIQEYFSSTTHFFNLSFELSLDDDIILNVYIPSQQNELPIYHIHSFDKSYGSHINNLNDFLKKEISSNVFNYVRCELDYNILFIVAR